MPLCILFNKSVESGLTPDELKVAVVTVIFKKGTKSDPGNYRPVSVTCVACKLLESFIEDAVVEHMTDNCIQNSNMGFRNTDLGSIDYVSWQWAGPLDQYGKE